MDKGVKESIDKFEFKKEFREVKLKTRQSFREDQVALEKRLSKYRVSTRETNTGNNKEIKTSITNASDKSEPVSVLESIVMDVSRDGEGESPQSQDNTDSLGSNPSDLSNGAASRTVHNGYTNGHANGHSDSRKASLVSNGSHSDKSSSSVNAVNGVIPTGKPPTTGSMNRPGSGSRGIRTPDLKTVAGRRLLGIYEKNPRLMSSSTDHLDNISLKGSKTHGSKIVVDHRQNVVSVPSVLGAEVACIPGDGNLASFSVEEMVTVFRMLKVQEEAIYRLNGGKVDGKRFSRFSDKELSDIGIFNPIIKYFRDRSQLGHTVKKRPGFML